MAFSASSPPVASSGFTASSARSLTSSSSRLDGGAARHVWGITIDDPYTNRAAIVESLSSLRQPMLTRIVFDEGVAASEYDLAVRDLHRVSSIQGLVVDSLYVPRYSTSAYVARFNEYLDQLADVVDVWEVGNEINGEWVGSASEVSAKILGAYRAVKARGGRTALTLYYNGTYDNGVATANNCWEQPGNQMQVWAAAHVPDELKTGLDDLWVSYYEDDCNGLQPDWSAVFTDLAVMFPSSKLGIGECGTTRTGTAKQTYIQRYYRDLHVTQDRYVGGYFWWYGKQDFVPRTNPLWTTLQDAMNTRELVEGL